MRGYFNVDLLTRRVSVVNALMPELPGSRWTRISEIPIEIELKLRMEIEQRIVTLNLKAI